MGLKFLEKALGAFVEFEPEKASDRESKKEVAPVSASMPRQNSGLTMSNLSTINGGTTPVATVAPTTVNKAEAEKFLGYFEKLFTNANLPGPDYFEFNKMLETLEAHIKDNTARISATFASLSIQGLTKEKLLQSAAEYQRLLQEDRANFENALRQKAESEIGSRKQAKEALQQKVKESADLVAKLTKEITDSQLAMEKLEEEIANEEVKLTANSNGYILASNAMISQIQQDVAEINQVIK